MSNPNRNECSYSEKPNSSDTISRQAAIDALEKAMCEDGFRSSTGLIHKTTAYEIIRHLPSVQGKPFNLPEIYIADGYDTIEGEDGNVGFGVYVPDENQIYVAGDVEGEIRARALLHEICHWVQAMCGRSFDEDEANEFSDIVYDALPSAQETHEERTETHACDLISRQAAIDEIGEWIKAFLENGHKESAADARLIQDGIIQLPSVQPKRKTGKWNFIGDNMFECTSCGVVYTTEQLNGLRNYDTDPYAPRFCPNCGADMRGG